MIRVQQEFQDRVNEIGAFFQFIEKVDSGEVLLIQRDSTVPAYVPQVQEDLLRTFKASAFLLLYNLMESTVTNAVEAIFDEMKRHNILFDSCREEIRIVVLENLKRHKSEKILPSLNQLATDIITKTFRKEEIVSGNVDARVIKAIADSYGFMRPSANGDDLLTIKSQRNDLAHGVKSFAEVGRTFAMPDIIRHKDQVITYLSSMLSSVETYITQQNYLSATGRP